MSKNKKTIKVGTIDGNELLLNRKGKAHKGDPLVSRGCGEHLPEEFKEKNRQREKNSLRELYK